MPNREGFARAYKGAEGRGEIGCFDPAELKKVH